MSHKIRLIAKFTPIEQRYLSTCYPLPDRPFYDEAMVWKENMRYLSMKNETIDVSLRHIVKAFPHLGALYVKGLFDKRTVKSYFEGTDQDSHNMRMYLFAKSAYRKGLPEKALLDVLEHVEACSVKPADLRNSLIYSYGDNYHSQLDTEYLDIVPESDFVFVHGRSPDGEIVIRDVMEEKFEALREWFDKRKESKSNPFVKFRDIIYKHKQ